MPSEVGAEVFGESELLAQPRDLEPHGVHRPRLSLGVEEDVRVSVALEPLHHLPHRLTSIGAPFSRALVKAVLRSECTPMPRPPTRSASIPTPWAYFLTISQIVVRGK